MTLMSALSAAVSGLRTTQAGIAVVSQNVANADSVGYTKRRLQPVEAVAGDRSAGVRAGEIQRVLDRVVQRQLWQENSGSGYTGLRATMSGALERLYGPPGSASALDTLLNGFSGALERLVDDPASTTARTGVIGAGRTLASRIGAVAEGVQALRTEAEGRIATLAEEANTLLAGIERVNRSILSEGPTAPLADERDRLIGQLSAIVDLQVHQGGNGSVTITTGAGQTLFDGARALRFEFEGRTQLGPQNRYDTTPPSVGVLSLVSATGARTDLVAAGAVRSGALGAALEMRDETLVQAQLQLDELAAGLARGFSDEPATVTGTTPAFTLSSAAYPLTVEIAVGGTFVRASAGSEADLNAALAPHATIAGTAVNVPGGTVLSAATTRTGTAGTGAFAFFEDPAQPPGYTGANDQITGFAQRIRVNSAVASDPSLLVNSAFAGDPARPGFMRDGLARSQTFASQAGLSGSAPFQGDVASALRRTVEVQGAAAATSARLDEGQSVALATVEGRFAQTSGVNIDEEMSQLVQLQTAYGANARVMSAVREMMDVLLRI
ncbi:flagellar hook-associated protein FlgK [Salinarimonas sp.]|uniref:flagellar hook-associated protein FlgK n=1 Tax=Salinarimonas sp. TaxID=2766526 RepID=UPI0032D8CA44